MQNHLSDLNNHLFAELERLSDEEMDDGQIEREIARAKAINATAQAIVANGNLALRAAEFKDSAMDQLAPRLIHRARDKGYSAVIIDPIYKVITGDENSADEMAAFCNQFDRVAEQLGTAVIYCHHHSKGAQGGKRSMTISLPEEDRSYLSKRYMEDQIVALLGGRVAEKLVLGDISTGASNDIQRASQIAHKMVAVYGMTYEILLIVVIGGIGSISGSVIAAFLFVGCSEWWLRFLDNEAVLPNFNAKLLFSIVLTAAVLGLLFLVLRRLRKADTTGPKSGGSGKKKLALKPSGIVAVVAGAFVIVWAWYFVISPKLELPLLRSGFRMVVFSVIIMMPASRAPRGQI